MNRTASLTFGLVTLLLASAAHPASADMPIGVSPGGGSGVQRVAESCTTFSWAGVEGAAGYMLEVYEAPRDDDSNRPVIRESIPAGASSWTVPADQCLANGRTYGWTIAAIDVEGRLIWSDPVLFTAVPSRKDSELREVLSLVRSYLTQLDSRSDSELATEQSVHQDSLPSSPASESVPLPSLLAPTALSVDGGVEADSFSGDGSGLTNVTAVAASTASHADEADSLDRHWWGTATSAGCTPNGTSEPYSCCTSCIVSSASTNEKMQLAKGVWIPSTSDGILKVTLGDAVYCSQPSAISSFSLEIIASLSATGSSPIRLEPTIRALAIPEAMPDAYGPAESQKITAQVTGNAFFSTSTAYYLFARVIDKDFGSSSPCYLMKADVIVEFLPGASVRTGLSP